jgi:cysteine synthase A
MRICDSMLDTIGNTPLVRAPRFCAGLAADLVFKLESFNPMSSVKDRPAREMIVARGAQVVLTSGDRGMRGAIERARPIRDANPGSWIAGQFTDPANVAAHRKTAGPEIWRDTGGAVDVCVTGVGTGGTLTGAESFLKEKKPELYIGAVEPARALWRRPPAPTASRASVPGSSRRSSMST